MIALAPLYCLGQLARRALRNIPLSLDFVKPRCGTEKAKGRPPLKVAHLSTPGNTMATATFDRPQPKTASKKKSASRRTSANTASLRASARSRTDKAPAPVGKEAPFCNRLIPNYRETFKPEEFVGTQALARIHDIAINWWTKLEALRENDNWGIDCKGTLPEWARELVCSHQQQHAAHEELIKWADMANRAARLSEGKQVGAFEVWTERGNRLDGQHTFWTEAESARERLSARFHDAFVARVHPWSPVFSGNNAELLDTLIGRMFWCGVAFGGSDEPDHHSVQDSTGRTVTVTAAELIAHPAFQRMTADAHQQIAIHEEHAQRRHERLAAAKEE